MIYLKRETIKNLIPFLTVILIILGFFRLNMIYRNFHINIIDYIELSEVLTVFLPTLLKTGVLIFFVMFFDFISTPKWEQERDIDFRNKFYSKSSMWERLKWKYEFTPILFLMSIFSLVSIIIISILSMYNTRVEDVFWDLFIVLSIPIVILVVSFLFGEYRFKYYQFNERYLDTTMNNLIFLVIMLVFQTLLSIKGEISNIENSKEIVSFSYLDNEVLSNNNLIFVGQTNRYLFLSDIEKNKTYVYERSDVKNITIQNFDEK